MKKNVLFLLIFSIITTVYISLSFLIKNDKNNIFWIGLRFMILSIVIMGVITGFSILRKTLSFPFKISLIAFSAIYVTVVFLINTIFNYTFSTPVNIFILVHIICFALFVLTILLILILKAKIIRSNKEEDEKEYEVQVLLYSFEKIKLKLVDMEDKPRREATSMLDSLLEELRFSYFGISVDVSDIDNRLCIKSEELSSEVDNLIAIKSTDLTSMKLKVDDIKRVIKDRNMQIRLMSSNIYGGNNKWQL